MESKREIMKQDGFPAMTSACQYWPSGDNTQYFTYMTANVILASAFSMSYFFEEPWIWIR